MIFRNIIRILIVSILTISAFMDKANTGQQKFILDIISVKWLKREPTKICDELVKSPQMLLNQYGTIERLVFTFQGIEYSVPNQSADPKKLNFKYAADSDSGAESTTISIDGVKQAGELNGAAKIEIQKDVSLTKGSHEIGWGKHKYNCGVNYSFYGKINTD